MQLKYCPLCGSDLVAVEIDGKPREKCSSEKCDFTFWNNPIPVVAAIVELGDDVILVRNKDWPEKMFGLVTGFLEEGETVEDAIIREVNEELGLQARIQSFIGCYSFFQMNQLILAFHVKADGKIVLGEELIEFKAVPPDRLRPWKFGTGYAVSDWLKKRNQ
jgi:NADH pyrophosphatase NudC (nudix superfamily)